MDDFGLDRPELSGGLINLEFAPGGRIQQLWVADPSNPDGEEFQFVCPPMPMGEEYTEDYFPGTLLLGARTDPDAPWILARNTHAQQDHEDEGPGVLFNYDLGLLEELEASGRFQELPGPAPQVAWDIHIRNHSRRSVEIGEIGFPMALNNVYEGYPRTDKGIREMLQDRVIVHEAIGGSASYLFAQRLTARAPGLLIYPGDNTSWEFIHHIRASLNTPYRWNGIPAVYVHSRATVEREEWPEWFDGHTATILEPGEDRRYQIRFAPAERDRADNVSNLLAAIGRPAIRLFPSAVAPRDAGIAVEVLGATPARFETDLPAETETDADEEGGYCFVRPAMTGSMRLGFEDTLGRQGHAHLLFTEPLADLIDARARWIVENQRITDGPLQGAILPADNETMQVANELDAIMHPFGIASGLADALFLAEKNVLRPRLEQIEALEDYVRFLESTVVNPGDGAVGSVMPNALGVAVGYGRESNYALVASFYATLARVTPEHADRYLRAAAATADAMIAYADISSHGSLSIYLLQDVLQRLVDAGREDDASRLKRWLEARWTRLASRAYPFFGDTLVNSFGYAEIHEAARRRDNPELAERAMRLAYAARSLSPSWWWYGTDVRWTDDPQNDPVLNDKASLCGSPTSVANAGMVLSMLDRDAPEPAEAYLRSAFGGMMQPWALVRDDGAAAMGFTPDAASEQFGIARSTGDIGLSLALYLRLAASFVLPSRSGLQTFGCFFDVDGEGIEESCSVRPWDGVGRRIAVRQLGLDLECDRGGIVEARFDTRKRALRVRQQNAGDRRLIAVLRVRGLWGRRFSVNGIPMDAEGAWLRIPVEIAPGGEATTEIEVL